MKIDRIRPTGVPVEDLDLWLSCLIHDAVRDTLEAGLDPQSASLMLDHIADTYRTSRRRSAVEAPTGSPFWVGWWEHMTVGFTLSTPWWQSTFRQISDTELQPMVCAAVMATSANDAKAKILHAHDVPVELDWAFVKEQPRGWVPYTDIFPMRVGMRWPG